MPEYGFSFELPCKPMSTNQIYKTTKKLRGMYMTKEGKDYKQAIHAKAKAEALQQGYVMREGDYHIVVIDIRPDRIKVDVRVLDLDGRRPAKMYRGDVDGPIKNILDSLQGVAYENDRSVAIVFANKVSVG